MVDKKTTPQTSSRRDEINILREKIQNLNILVDRYRTFSQLGLTYGGDRNLYEILGYKENLSWDDYYLHYQRQDIAKTVIDRPVEVSWRGDIRVLETDDEKETAFERDYVALEERLKLKDKFIRLDKLTGLGHYAVLLLGFTDAQNTMDWMKPVQPSATMRLAYVTPLAEPSALIDRYEDDPANERFGLPLIYNVNIKMGPKQKTLKVHYSRVLHVVDGELFNDVEGTPRLEVLFNRLEDLEKLLGGSAEMFWKGARPGYQNIAKPDYEFGDEEITKMSEQISEFEHGLRRILNIQGGELKSLAIQAVDPKNHIDVQIQFISAVTNIPKRILTGSERGELSSAQDADEHRAYIKSRRETFNESKIVRPFIDYLIKLKVLSKPTQKYTVYWEDLFAPSESDKATVGKTRTAALKEYASETASWNIVSPDAFLKYFLGFDEDTVELIQEMTDGYQKTAIQEELNFRNNSPAPVNQPEPEPVNN